MKKILLGIAVVAATLALASCDRTNGKKQPISYEAPVYQTLAAKYTVSKSEDAQKVNSFEITAGGLYVVVTPNEVISGTIDKPVISDGRKEIPLKGYGNVLILEAKAAENVTLTFTPTGKDPITVDAVAEDQEVPASDEFMFKLVRTWKVASTTVTVSGGDLPKELGVAMTFPGCSLPEIKEWAEDKGKGKLDMGNVSGYVVEDITFTPSSFIVRFKDADAIDAALNLGDAGKNEAKFTYTVSASQLNVPLFNNGVANGVIKFDELGALSVVLEASVDVSNTEYKGKAIFKLEKKEL